MKYCKKHAQHYRGIRCPECTRIPDPPQEMAQDSALTQTLNAIEELIQSSEAQVTENIPK